MPVELSFGDRSREGRADRRGARGTGGAPNRAGPESSRSVGASSSVDTRGATRSRARRGREPAPLWSEEPPSIVGARGDRAGVIAVIPRGRGPVVRAADAVGTPVVFVQLWPRPIGARRSSSRPSSWNAGPERAFRGGHREDGCPFGRKPRGPAGRVPVLESRRVECRCYRARSRRPLGLMGARRRPRPDRQSHDAAADGVIASGSRSSEGRSELPPAAVAGRDPRGQLCLRAAARARGGCLPTPSQTRRSRRGDVGARGAPTQGPGSRPKLP